MVMVQGGGDLPPGADLRVGAGGRVRCAVDAVPAVPGLAAPGRAVHLARLPHLLPPQEGERCALVVAPCCLNCVHPCLAGGGCGAGCELRCAEDGVFCLNWCTLELTSCVVGTKVPNWGLAVTLMFMQASFTTSLNS